MALKPKESDDKIARRHRDGRWIARVLKLIGATLRIKVIDPHGVCAHLGPLAEPVIYAHWHSWVMVAPLSMDYFVPPPRRNTALVSASGDGEMLATVMKAFRIDSVRGSTSRGGAAALRTLVRELQNGSDISITPDGPRGPRGVISPGVIALAKLTGAPVVPVRFELGWSFRVKTWDRMRVPLPFSACRMMIQEPRRITKDMKDDDALNWLAKEMGEP
jgi:lysophospholipid acyltransferase (LPLAT)-like uncharacterized protein